MYTLSLLFIYFFLYSLLGWIAEFFYMLAVHHRIKRPDFLWMPLAMPYGLGALAVILFIEPYFTNPFVVFILGVVVTTAIEFVSHWLLETIFHVQAWNYEHKKFNFQGRIALVNSLCFGVLSLLLVYVIHPVISTYTEQLPHMWLYIIAGTLALALLIDSISATGSLIKLRISKINGPLGDVLTALQQQFHHLVSKSMGSKKHGVRAWLLRIHRANIGRLHRAYPDASLYVKKRKR